jgi:hypothetical protein
MILVKLDSAVAEVPTDINVSSGSMYWSRMYESLSKRDCNIILSCCPDMGKSYNLYHFDQYKGIIEAIFEAHIWNTLYGMHKVWDKKNYSEIHSINC